MNITFDLETLGTDYNAPIVQIAGVKFKDDGTIVSNFSANININSLYNHGFEIDFDTLKWWFSQEDSAIKAVFCNEENYSISVALSNFIEWAGDCILWSHKDFDSPILKNALKSLGFNEPNKYNQMDIRTITHIAKKVSGIEPKEVIDSLDGIKHNALDDCLYQVKLISKSIELIKWK